MNHDEMQAVFADWNKTCFSDSYLVEITADILATKMKTVKLPVERSGTLLAKKAQANGQVSMH